MQIIDQWLSKSQFPFHSKISLQNLKCTFISQQLQYWRITKSTMHPFPNSETTSKAVSANISSILMLCKIYWPSYIAVSF